MSRTRTRIQTDTVHMYNTIVKFAITIKSFSRHKTAELGTRDNCCDNLTTVFRTIKLSCSITANYCAETPGGGAHFSYLSGPRSLNTKYVFTLLRVAMSHNCRKAHLCQKGFNYYRKEKKLTLHQLNLHFFKVIKVNHSPSVNAAITLSVT